MHTFMYSLMTLSSLSNQQHASHATISFTRIDTSITLYAYSIQLQLML